LNDMQYKKSQLVFLRTPAGINLFIVQVSNQQRRDREREEWDREYGLSNRMA